MSGINQFVQADTLIPNPHNSLDWNRYSYARYNPLLYTDPTGHVPCDEDGVCGDNIINSTYSKLIKDKFKWNLKGSWTTDELKTIYETGQDIEAYVDGLTGGKGLEWMLRAFANTTIEHVDFSDGHSDALPVWGGSRIRLNNNWLTNPWRRP